MSVESLPETWHRADYILRGDYCPLEDVHRQLECIRADLGAELVVHLAVDHESVLRSLNWATGEPAELCARVGRSLQEARFRPKQTEPLVRTVGARAERRVARLGPAAAGGLVDLLRTLKPDDSPLAELPGDGWDALVLNHTGRDGVPARPGEVRSILLVRHDRREPSTRPDELQTLGVMLKCTFRANTRRDTVVMQQVADRLSIAETEGADFPVVADQALALAREITGSVAGAVYLISTEQGVGYERVATQTTAPYAYPVHIAVSEDTSVSWAVGRHRAYQSEPGDVVPGHARAINAAAGTELVTPIAGALATTVGPAIGAIVLYQASDSAGYGAYEKALVRNVALRLALMRTTMATRRIANAISALRRTSLIHAQPDLTGYAARWPGWPKDINAAAYRLGEPLRELAEGTQSHSVTLRIALPDRTGPSHGLVLSRIVAHPPTESGAVPEVRDGDRGPHWDVMRTDTEVYVRDTEHDDRFVLGRPGTRSALCVPVRIEGILAGTLHLESPLTDNYAVFLPIIEAFCGAVGRTLADARAAQERRVLDRAAHALAKRHEFSGDIGELRRQVKTLRATPMRLKLLDRIGRMDVTIQDLRERETRGPLEPATLWQIIATAIKQVEFTDLRPPEDPVFHQYLDPSLVRPITDVVTSLIRNVNHHSAREAYDDRGQPVPRMRFATTALQGSTQAVVVLESWSADYLDESSCRELYRYPIDGDEGELRLGTYIAGLNARRVGGRIHACALADDRTFRTTLIIPLEEHL